jgi:hypothetical protein
VLDFGIKWICVVGDFNLAFFTHGNWNAVVRAGMSYVWHRGLCDVGRSRFDIYELRLSSFLLHKKPKKPCKMQNTVSILLPYVSTH